MISDRSMWIVVVGFALGAVGGGTLALLLVVSPIRTIYEPGPCPPTSVVIKRWITSDVAEIEYAVWEAGIVRDVVRVTNASSRNQNEPGWRPGDRVELRYKTVAGPVAIRDNEGQLVADP